MVVLLHLSSICLPQLYPCFCGRYLSFCELTCLARNSWVPLLFSLQKLQLHKFSPFEFICTSRILFSFIQMISDRCFSFYSALLFRINSSGNATIPCGYWTWSVRLFVCFMAQGFRWYAKRLRIDEDGDVADEFLEEVLPGKSAEEKRPLPSFQVKYNTRPVKMRNLFRSIDGKIQVGVESHGRLQWV